MLNLIKKFFINIWNNWVKELNRFFKSRKQIIKMKEFRIAIIISLLWPIFFALSIYFRDKVPDIVIVFMILIWTLMIIFYLIWISFLSAWSVLFDNIPTASDILWYMDYSEWSWLEKLKVVSKVWTFKEKLQNKVTDFFIRFFLKSTVFAFGLSMYYFKDSILSLFKFDFERFFKSLIKGWFLLWSPMFVWVFVWVFWIIWYMRISLTRLPIILIWFIFLLVVSVISQSINSNTSNFLGILFITLWYSYIFLEIEDLLKVKVIYKVLFEKIRGN